MNKGKIVQIIGPVVDIEFADQLPAIYNALTVEFTSPGAAGKTKRCCFRMPQFAACATTQSRPQSSPEAVKRNFGFPVRDRACRPPVLTKTNSKRAQCCGAWSGTNDSRGRKRRGFQGSVCVKMRRPTKAACWRGNFRASLARIRHRASIHAACGDGSKRPQSHEPMSSQQTTKR